jgi:hypothetical protein
MPAPGPPPVTADLISPVGCIGHACLLPQQKDYFPSGGRLKQEVGDFGDDLVLPSPPSRRGGRQEKSEDKEKANELDVIYFLIHITSFLPKSFAISSRQNIFVGPTGVEYKEIEKCVIT